MRSKNTSLNQAGKVVGELYMSNELHVQMSEFLVALGGVIAVPAGKQWRLKAIFYNLMLMLAPDPTYFLQLELEINKTFISSHQSHDVNEAEQGIHWQLSACLQLLHVSTSGLMPR